MKYLLILTLLGACAVGKHAQNEVDKLGKSLQSRGNDPIFLESPQDEVIERWEFKFDGNIVSRNYIYGWDIRQKIIEFGNCSAYLNKIQYGWRRSRPKVQNKIATCLYIAEGNPRDKYIEWFVSPRRCSRKNLKRIDCFNGYVLHSKRETSFKRLNAYSFLVKSKLYYRFKAKSGKFVFKNWMNARSKVVINKRLFRIEQQYFTPQEQPISRVFRFTQAKRAQATDEDQCEHHSDFKEFDQVHSRFLNQIWDKRWHVYNKFYTPPLRLKGEIDKTRISSNFSISPNSVFLSPHFHGHGFLNIRFHAKELRNKCRQAIEQGYAMGEKGSRSAFCYICPKNKMREKLRDHDGCYTHRPKPQDPRGRYSMCTYQCPEYECLTPKLIKGPDLDSDGLCDDSLYEELVTNDGHLYCPSDINSE